MVRIIVGWEIRDWQAGREENTLFFKKKFWKWLKTYSMKSNDLKVAWSLSAPEANLCRGSTKHSFFYSVYRRPFHGCFWWSFLYQFSDFCLSFAKILQSRNRKCKHYIIFSFFTEIFGDKISHIRDCSEVFQGSVVRS